MVRVCVCVCVWGGGVEAERSRQEKKRKKKKIADTLTAGSDSKQSMPSWRRLCHFCLKGPFNSLFFSFFFFFSPILFKDEVLCVCVCVTRTVNLRLILRDWMTCISFSYGLRDWLRVQSEDPGIRPLVPVNTELLRSINCPSP